MPRDKEKKRLYNARYHQEHKEEVHRRQKSYYTANAPHLRQYAREWAKSHPERVRRNKHQWRTLNREKVNASKRTPKYRAWARATEYKWHRKYWLKKKYGMTVQDYDCLFEYQKGKCAICGRTNDKRSKWGTKERFLQVDHCHTSNKVRGLLCYFCNVGIGLLRHDVRILKAAVSYLQNHK